MTPVTVRSGVLKVLPTLWPAVPRDGHGVLQEAKPQRKEAMQRQAEEAQRQAGETGRDERPRPRRGGKGQEGTKAQREGLDGGRCGGGCLAWNVRIRVVRFRGFMAFRLVG